ncbi:hypothetical protein ElyMa_005118300 [Elysia marginata]|uniref:VWFC domain-containing protein n=1 Tax=Elysia marginata TaxID=1093978 RepID=A0AAV4JMP7_9GAST|nr:hypothetical protein ElyMa_005118300 [Elysia marginata]
MNTKVLLPTMKFVAICGILALMGALYAEAMPQVRSKRSEGNCTVNGHTFDVDTGVFTSVCEFCFCSSHDSPDCTTQECSSLSCEDDQVPYTFSGECCPSICIRENDNPEEQG